MQVAEVIEAIEDDFLSLLAPPPDLTVTEWAEGNRIMSPENCSLPGPYRVSVTPYLKEILDTITAPNIERIVCQKSAQVGWTDGVINNAVGYYIDREPCPVLTLFPTESLAQRYSKEKLSPMIRDTLPLRDKVADPKSRDSNNTILSKNFKGGHLELVGSNSPVNLSSSPIRIVIVEEPDRCASNSGGEGNSLKLAYERSKTFFNRRLILGGSPTIKGFSEIEREMQLSDKRFYFIPCPLCGEFQTLKWSGVVWDKKPGREHSVFGDYVPESARYRCEHCAKLFSNAAKNEALSRGVWRPSAEFNGTAGFYINELMSPFPKATFADIAAKFLEARGRQKIGDESLMITFINTALGETWEEKGDGVERLELIERVETYQPQVLPSGVLVITCGVDVQDDRLEFEVVGWGHSEESWSLDYGQISGDPEALDVWKKLDKLLNRKFDRNGVVLRINAACIDSGAHTDSVYRFVAPRQMRRVYATKGKSTTGDPIVGKPSRKSIKKGLYLYPIGTDTAKDVIFGRLKLDDPGPGYCHFPDRYPEEYFKQLTAEKKFRRYEKGKLKTFYKKTRPRNEALDLRVLNLAALTILNPNFDAISTKLETRERANNEKKKAKAKPPIRRRRKTGFVNRY